MGAGLDKNSQDAVITSVILTTELLLFFLLLLVLLFFIVIVIAIVIIVIVLTVNSGTTVTLAPFCCRRTPDASGEGPTLNDHPSIFSDMSIFRMWRGLLGTVSVARLPVTPHRVGHCNEASSTRRRR